MSKKLHQLPCLSLDKFQHINIFPELRGPELGTALEMWPRQYHVNIPAPAGRALSDTGQVPLAFFFTWAGSGAPHAGSGSAAVDQHPQSLFYWADFQPLCPQSVELHGVIVAKV
ncbi:hypothetical protein DUI87_04240 [Hirundo rustica rustica]|uniref:Uncharacterized protein n=1 Tax=Hirundo rustica rustica TaxID=333673 RepID=A0A3M0L3D1_HIRRU|nr:hypothetical protein DUI87_04240 [Hirundo rustica rustica]